MAEDTLQRSRLLLGADSIQKLKDSTVLVVGTGGVGGFCVEALARAGIGHLVLIDKDVVEASNVNRQLCALHSTIGQVKVDVFKERIQDIDPDTRVTVFHQFYDQDLNEELDRLPIDFVCDCIDSMRSKEDLIEYCLQRHIPFITSMGMARRTDPAKLTVLELEETSGDPMAKRLRVWKRKSQIKEKIWTVCSTELPKPVPEGQPLPSMVFVPAAAGLLMADQAVKTLVHERK